MAQSCQSSRNSRLSESGLSSLSERMAPAARLDSRGLEPPSPSQTAGAAAQDACGAGLEVTHGIDGRAPRADLEVEMVAEAVAGAADASDHLPLADRSSDRDANRGLVCVAGGDSAA